MFWRKKEEILKPGVCECGHSRCGHEGGKGKCHNEDPPHSEYNSHDFWVGCACQVFILDDDQGGDDSPEVPDDPEVAELEKMVRQ